jgi:hypothetical protein
MAKRADVPGRRRPAAAALTIENLDGETANDFHRAPS